MTHCIHVVSLSFIPRRASNFCLWGGGEKERREGNLVACGGGGGGEGEEGGNFGCLWGGGEGVVACGEEERVRVGGNVMVGPCVAVYTR